MFLKRNSKNSSTLPKQDFSGYILDLGNLVEVCFYQFMVIVKNEPKESLSLVTKAATEHLRVIN